MADVNTFDSTESTQEETATLLFEPPSQPTAIGTLEVDVLLELSESWQSEAHEHPVEDGYPVHDHIINKPLKLSMLVMITPTPVTWYDRFGGPNPTRIQEAEELLKEIRRKREPITIVTNKRTYENMALVSKEISFKSEEGHSLRLPLEFVQIKKVNTRSAVVSEEVAAAAKNKAGQTEKNAGDAGDQSSSYGNSNSSSPPASEKKRESMARSIFG